MKAQRVSQTKQGAEPAALQDQGVGAIQRQAATTPRQTSEAAHIAQLKGETEPKGKMPPPKKGKGK
jgi:hypothetical protein